MVGPLLDSSFTVIRIFFSATLGIRIFFLEKNHKLNGRSLTAGLYVSTKYYENQGFQSGPVPGTFTRLRSCIVPAEKILGRKHIYLPHAQTAIYDSKIKLFLKQGISHQLGRDAVVRFEW
jgi:hypothetical protein